MSITHPGHVVGSFKTRPKGIILHGSRSGRDWSYHEEFVSTANWAMSANNPYGWNATIGEDEYATHMRPDQYGLNAGTLESSVYLAVEFAQNKVTTGISDGQVRAFVSWYEAEIAERWSHLLGLVLTPEGLPAHSELPQGVVDNKSDVFPRRDGRLLGLRSRLQTALKGVSDPYAAAKARLEAFYVVNHVRLALGPQQKFVVLDRPWGGPAIRCARGLIVDDGTEVHDETQRAIDDAMTYNQEHGTIIEY